VKRLVEVCLLGSTVSRHGRSVGLSLFGRAQNFSGKPERRTACLESSCRLDWIVVVCLVLGSINSEAILTNTASQKGHAGGPSRSRIWASRERILHVPTVPFRYASLAPTERGFLKERSR